MVWLSDREKSFQDMIRENNGIGRTYTQHRAPIKNFPVNAHKTLGNLQVGTVEALSDRDRELLFRRAV